MSQDEWKTACGAFFPRSRQYWVSFETTSGRVTMVYSERTGAWQKYDLPVEAYHVVNSEAGDPMLLGAIRGILCRLDYGANDGADVVSHTDLALSGTITSSTDISFSDSGATWPTSTYSGVAVAFYGRPLAGVPVFVKNQSTGDVQKRVVYFNTATEAYIEEPWDTNPTAGDTYYFGPIDWYWESPRIALDGDRTSEVILNRFYALFRDGGSGDVDAEFTQDTRDAVTKTLDASQRYNEFLPRSRGRELTIRLSDYIPEDTVEVESFGVLFSQDDPRTENG
jgi:hypothetical protein